MTAIQQKTMTPHLSPEASRPTLSDGLIAALNELLRAEVPAVNLSAAVAPILAPVFPALYTWHNVSFVMLQSWVGPLNIVAGGFVAAAVEFTGFSSVYSVINMWGEKGREGLVAMAALSLALYLTVVIGTNVSLDIHAKKPDLLIFSSVLPCFLTVIGGIIAGVRARVARAAADEQAKQDAATAQAAKDLAEDARQFNAEMSQWEAKRQAEAEAQRAQREHEERMAQLAAEAEQRRMQHELDMALLQQQAQPQQQPQPRNNSRATGRNEDVLRLHAENPTWDNATIARELGIHRGTVGRILARTNGNGATK